jgi:putative tricarboxylic transport membrane protein
VAKLFANFRRVRYSILGPVIFVFAAIGSFGIRNDLTDVWIMLAFGLLGYFFKKYKYPIAPMIIGLVLGPLTEVSLRKGLYMTDYALGPFLLRPIAGTILLISAASVLWNLYSVFIKKGRASLEDVE